MSRYFLKTFCMYAMPIPVQTKVHFENLQFLMSIKEQRKLWILTFFFFVNVCLRLVCAVYFVIVPIGYTLLYSRMNFKLCSIHISACHCNACCR